MPAMSMVISMTKIEVFSNSLREMEYTVKEIQKLPDGYNTSAGEAGKRLSGGERQRIAIARMMLKNAPIVILDEATAFTDPENEGELYISVSISVVLLTIYCIALWKTFKTELSSEEK